MKPNEIFKTDVINIEGAVENATFTVNAYSIPVRRWCKSCGHCFSSIKSGYICKRDNHAIENSRGCCEHYRMEDHLSQLGSPALAKGRVKSPEYIHFLISAIDSLLHKWTEMPADRREDWGSFYTFVHTTYEDLTNKDIYGNRLEK